MTGPDRGSVFAVGTGRCGTHLLAELLGHEPGVVACHEADPLGESFHRYCLWNGLPAADDGFIEGKRRQIAVARREGAVFFEASAYLALSVGTLYDAFGSRFVLLTRNPADTVNSLWVKGWYRGDRDAHAAPHHAFSRLVPNGDELERWQRLTRIGKLAWFWSALHRATLDRLAALPPAQYRTVRLEELDHEAYVRLARFAGIASELPRARFEEVAARRPGALWARRHVSSWSGLERAEFAREVAGVAPLLGYDVHATRGPCR